MSGEEPSMEHPTLLEQKQAMLVNNNEILKNDINNTINNVNNNMNKINDKVESLQIENIATREELLARIDTKSRLFSRTSSRASSKTLSSTHLAVTLTATIPVVILPTVLKTTPLSIESSPSHMDLPLSVTNISVLGSPESLETVIKVPVRTPGSLYDTTPTVDSNHATEELPMDISPDMVTEELNDKKSVILCDFHDQLSHSTQQLGYPFPIITEDNFCGNKHECFSEHSNATLYSVWGTVHGSITMALVT
jgi:Txe/YoeB family toxin of Txe-Axe toxin-antitoxin module